MLLHRLFAGLIFCSLMAAPICAQPRTVRLVPFTPIAGHVDALALSPDGKLLATGDQRDVKIWLIEGEQLLRVMIGHDAVIRALTFSADGKQILSGSYDGTAKLWDVDTGQLLKSFNDHALSVNAAAYFPDEKRIVTGSFDTTLKIWDRATGRLLRTLKGHTKGVFAVAVSADGKFIASGGVDRATRSTRRARNKVIRGKVTDFGRAAHEFRRRWSSRILNTA